MPISGTDIKIYHWNGLNKLGRHLSGKLAAKSEKQVKEELLKQGITLIKASTGSVFAITLFRKKIKKADLTLSTRLIATMFAAGIPLHQALESIISGDESPEMRALLQSLRNELDAGSSFAAALKKHPDYFDELYCNIVDAGEQSGTLDVMLERVADHQENLELLKSKAKKALIYPVFVISAALCITMLILIFVVPQFETLFANANIEFPLITKIVLGLSRSLENNWWQFSLVLVAGIASIKYALRHSPSFTLFFDKMLLRLPIVGKILKLSIIARFTQTLKICLAAGIPIIDALDHTAGVTGNLVYYNAIKDIRENIRIGQQLYFAMTLTQAFPVVVIKMISAGEESGSLDLMLEKISTFYERQVNFSVDNLGSLLEPLIIIILGLLIGGLIVALYLPIFKMGLVV